MQKKSNVIKAPITRDFVYGVTFNDLLRGTTNTKSIQIYSVHDFEIFFMTSNVSIGLDSPNGFGDVLSGQHFNGLFVLLTENSTGENLSDQPVPLTSMFGTGQQPFILPNTKILEANTVLSIQLSNRYTAQDFAKIELSFIGRTIERDKVAYAG